MGRKGVFRQSGRTSEVTGKQRNLSVAMSVAGFLIPSLFTLWMLGCPGNRYVEPTSGPTATIEISSICIERATFFARINGQRTDRYGCNETARFSVGPGQIALVVQVEQSDFAIEPLSIDFEIQTGHCAHFLLRQANGYQLEFLGVDPCD